MVRQCQACGEHLPGASFCSHNHTRCRACVRANTAAKRAALKSARLWSWQQPNPPFDAEQDRLDEIADLNALHLAWHHGREPNLDAVG